MCEDIRLEKNGQCTLVGILSDRIYTKMWPVQFLKLCFHVRVRGVEGTPSHSLALWSAESKEPVAKMEGEANRSESDVSIFNYFIAPGPLFPKPARYSAKFALREDSGVLVAAEYDFELLNPNPDELYVQCTKCGVKFASGFVAKDARQRVGCESACPKCQQPNPIDAKTAVHLPNPK
jgi:hypothetical protein